MSTRRPIDWSSVFKSDRTFFARLFPHGGIRRYAVCIINASCYHYSTGIELIRIFDSLRDRACLIIVRHVQPFWLIARAGSAIGTLVTCAGGPASLSFELPFCSSLRGPYAHEDARVCAWKIDAARKIKAASAAAEIANKSHRFTEKPGSYYFFFPLQESTPSRVL